MPVITERQQMIVQRLYDAMKDRLPGQQLIDMSDFSHDEIVSSRRWIAVMYSGFQYSYELRLELDKRQFIVSRIQRFSTR